MREVVTSGYLRTAVLLQRELITQARKVLKSHKFDTILMTGVSGMIVGSALCYALKKHPLILRKQPDLTGGSHASSKFEGVIGGRVLVLDDFTATCTTLRRMVTMYQTECEKRGVPFDVIGAYFYGEGDRDEDRPQSIKLDGKLHATVVCTGHFRKFSEDWTLAKSLCY